jgi:hypothetical protein
MSAYAAAASFIDRRSEPREVLDQFYSVEFCLDGLGMAYQFKIWNVASRSMCVLVKEDSEILSRLKVGEVFNMKYYTHDRVCPTTYLETAIRHITRDDHGRFKGHYLVGLEIITDSALPPN